MLQHVPASTPPEPRNDATKTRNGSLSQNNGRMMNAPSHSNVPLFGFRRFTYHTKGFIYYNTRYFLCRRHDAVIFEEGAACQQE